MKTHFVQTQNYARLLAGMTVLEQRGSRESGGMVITGRPGDGKTTNLKNLGSRLGAVFVTCTQGMSPGRLVEALADRLGLPATRYIDEAIGERLTLDQTPVLLDEAQFALADGAACLERLRSITDKSGTPFVLVFMERDLWRVGQREQISSRIACRVEFRPAELDDITEVCRQLSDVAIAPDLVKRIHTDTQGRMRSVLNAISRIEIAARTLGKTAVAAADLRQVVLCDDYRAGLAGLERGGRTTTGRAA
ncbi:MAG: hypothetical protein RLY71_464 [Pseudomonadota bacterium]|jgi:DNA transposition AAA+ family ATPase